MALLNKKITPGEIAAVYYSVFSGCQDWRQLYAIADGIKSDEKQKEINRSTIYAWKNTTKIQELFRDVERRKLELIQAAEKQGFQDGKNSLLDNIHTENETGGKKPKIVDYADPTNQARKLNELVNTAADPGEALDALKVIIQTQKADREAARDQKTVRAYLPLSCNSCPFLEKARKKSEKR